MTAQLNTFSRYVLNRTATPFAVGVVLVLMVLSLERILRLVEKVTEQQAGFLVLFKLLALLQPHYLGLAIPAALFFGTLIAFRRLSDNSELVVMRAAGISLWRMLVPAVCLGAGLSVVMFILVDMAQPYGRYAYRATVQNMEVQGQVLRLKPGYFESFGENTVVRADAVSKDGYFLKGFFAWSRDEGGEETIITSRLAQIAEPEDDGSLSVLLTDGKIMTKKVDQQKAALLTVQNYTWKIPIKELKAYGPRGKDQREMTLFELRRGGIHNVLEGDAEYLPKQKPSTVKRSGMADNDVDSDEIVILTPEIAKAEYHKRLVQVVSLPFLVLLAIPLAFIGQGRTGRATGLILGLVVLVLYEKTLSFGESFVSKGVLSPLVGLWIPFYILVAASVISVLNTSELFTPFFRQLKRRKDTA